jgi:hypothetical protein
MDEPKLSILRSQPPYTAAVIMYLARFAEGDDLALATAFPLSDQAILVSTTSR